MTVRLPAAERRQQLLDVALEVFAQRGYHDTSMSEIAGAAGVTKPVLYQHFGSKREFFLQVLREVAGELSEAVGKATASAPGPREQVESGFKAYFEWVARHRGGFEVLFTGEARRDAEFVAEARKVESDIAETIAALILIEGLDDERRRVTAYAIVGMSETISRHWIVANLDLSPDELAATAAELAWAGLRGVRPA